MTLTMSKFKFYKTLESKSLFAIHSRVVPASPPVSLEAILTSVLYSGVLGLT